MENSQWAKSPRTKTKSRFLKKFRRDKYLLLLLIPGLIYVLIYKYLPMAGLVIAFKDLSIVKGIFESPWVGLKHFNKLFSSADFWNVLKNTLTISGYKILFGFPAPIIIALMLNEIKSTRFKKSVQTIIYIPHFISWIVIHGILLSLLSPSFGIAGEIMKFFGMQPVNLLASTSHIRGLLVVSEIWKEVGWGTIVYLAAITTINPNLYEAAMIDGANKTQQMLYISIPCISGVIILLLILRIGNLMNAGFEQVLALQNDLVRRVTDIFDTYVYRRGLQLGEYSFTTAVGLFNSVVSMILVVVADRVAKLMGEEGLF